MTTTFSDRPYRYFEYCTYTDVKASNASWYGASPAPYTDAQILEAIRQAGDRLNALTGQWFIPIDGAWEWSGDESSILCDRMNPVPIIRINSVYPIDERDINGEVSTLGTALSAGDYTIDSNRKRLRMISGDWSEGFKNYQVNAVLGNMDRYGYLSTTLSSALAVGSSTFTVPLTTSIYKGDVLIIDDDYYVIVLGVANTTVTTVTIAAPLTGELAATKAIGSTVVRYGCIHNDIRTASIMLVNMKIGPEGTGLYGDYPAGMLAEEKTDNYSYRLAGPYGSSSASVGLSTGSAFIDEVINKYRDAGEVYIT